MQDDELPGCEDDCSPVVRTTLAWRSGDRAFTDDGQLYYPAYKDDPLPGTGETVGDVVPGNLRRVWRRRGLDSAGVLRRYDPRQRHGMAELRCGRRRPEFRILNGSDSRFYILTLSNPYVEIYLVANDSGLLPEAITISDGDGVQEAGEFILLAPGDRVELVFDFSKLGADETVKLLNSGPLFEPFKGVTADGLLLGDAVAATEDDPVGNIMQFTVHDRSRRSTRSCSMAGASRCRWP